MRGFLYWLVIFAMFTSVMPLSTPVASQSPTASVSIECQELVLIDVYPGSTGIGQTTCTLSNPSAYQEKIEISVDSSILPYSAPGSIIVGPGEEVDFQVSYRAETNMLVQTISSIVKAQVEEMNGAPPPNLAEDESSIMINIMQFGRCDVQLEEAYIELDVNVNIDLELKLFNQGNGEDIIKIGIENQSKNMLEEAGFVLSFPTNSVTMNPQGEPELVFFNLKSPSATSTSAVVEDGLLTDYFSIDIYAMSDHECRSTSCAKTSVTLTVKILETQPEEPQPDETIGIVDVNSDETLVYATGGGVLLLLIVGLLFFRKP